MDSGEVTDRHGKNVTRGNKRIEKIEMVTEQIIGLAVRVAHDQTRQHQPVRQAWNGHMQM